MFSIFHNESGLRHLLIKLDRYLFRKFNCFYKGLSEGEQVISIIERTDTWSWRLRHLFYKLKKRFSLQIYIKKDWLIDTYSGINSDSVPVFKNSIKKKERAKLLRDEKKLSEKIQNSYIKIQELTNKYCVGCIQYNKFPGDQNSHHVFRCCNDHVCEVMELFFKEAGFSYPHTGNKNARFCGPAGCIVKPEHRPLCSSHICGMLMDDDSWRINRAIRLTWRVRELIYRYQQIQQLLETSTGRKTNYLVTTPG